MLWQKKRRFIYIFSFRETVFARTNKQTRHPNLYPFVCVSNHSILSCPLLPWLYLWTNFKSKSTNGLSMTLGWLRKYQIKYLFHPWMFLPSSYASFSQNQKFPSLKAFSNPKGEQGAAGGGSEASLSNFLKWNLSLGKDFDGM